MGKKKGKIKGAQGKGGGGRKGAGMVTASASGAPTAAPGPTPRIAAARSVVDHLAGAANGATVSAPPALGGGAASSDTTGAGVAAAKDVAGSSSVVLQCHRIDTLGGELLNWAFELTERNMKALYESCGDGWHAKAKRREMKTPWTHYIVAVEAPGEAGATGTPGAAAAGESAQGCGASSDGSAAPAAAMPPRPLGFASVLFDVEDGCEVGYCYEFQVAPEAHGRGVGAALMRAMAGVVRGAGVGKVMLTCFRENAPAQRFFRKHGFVVDDFSPDDAEYTILSLNVAAGAEGGRGEAAVAAE